MKYGALDVHLFAYIFFIRNNNLMSGCAAGEARVVMGT
jgi:hypothetical protein